MQAHSHDECRANALHCVDIAEHAHTPDDRSDFLAFPEAWFKLADEIDHSARLISFIDALGAPDPVKEEAALPEPALQSLRRLTAAIVAIPNRFIADRLTSTESNGL
jgi:uncharacterized protein Yka (UPF0111/DUF47 family)